MAAARRTPQPPPPIEPLWRPPDIARWAGVSGRAVRGWRAIGKLPPPDYLIAGRPAWRRETIERHFAANLDEAGRADEAA